MTAGEIVVVVNEVRRERRREFAPDPDRTHDRYGNDITDHRVFDNQHAEDVFPY